MRRETETGPSPLVFDSAPSFFLSCCIIWRARNFYAVIEPDLIAAAAALSPLGRPSHRDSFFVSIRLISRRRRRFLCSVGPIPILGICDSGSAAVFDSDFWNSGRIGSRFTTPNFKSRQKEYRLMIPDFEQSARLYSARAKVFIWRDPDGGESHASIAIVI